MTGQTPTQTGGQPEARVLVLYHSVTGHVGRLADAIAEGIDSVAGCEAVVTRIPESVDAEKLYGAASVPDEPVDDRPAADPATLADYDGFAVGSPVHFAAPSAAVSAFLAATGRDWMAGTLISRPATVFVAGGSGGGRESAILALWAALASHGMTIVPPGNRSPAGTDLSAPNGSSPFGAGTLSGAFGDRPSEAELAAAVAQGRALAEVALAWRRYRGSEAA